ncbi:GNAT family N-acetyltransferase [Aestuariivirga sp.]|uniref:GNAT family N-acetyltransferase n=1 Tax=Aestuariivirga sp. TaxID=2650926 RepID=UPI0035945DC8
MAKPQSNVEESVLRRAIEDRPAQAPACLAVPRAGHLSILRDTRSFLNLETQWRQLEADAYPHRNAFQRFDWLKNWITVYGDGLGEDPLCVALGHADGRLVFAWPMMLARSGPVTLLRWMSDPYAQYGDVLVARGECPKAWMADALREISARRGIDGIRLRHVREDAASAPFLTQHFRDARFAEAAPCLDLTAFPDEAAYDARYSSAQRKRRKKIRKALEDNFGPVGFTVLKPGQATDEAIGLAIAEKSQWIDERGRQNRILGCPRMATFLMGLARGGTSAELVVTSLSAGGRPVSWEIGIRSGGVHHAFITSHVNAFTDLSPARLHMDLSQRQAIRDGMKVFDLLLPNDPYKDSWSSGRVATSDYHLPLGALGWAYGAGYLEQVRPVLRHAYYRMPPAVLRLLKPIVRH